MNINAVILAAGHGTRMKSNLPKVLHPLAGKPLISYLLEAVVAACSKTPVVVVGHGADQVTAVLGDQARTVVQEPQLGTAHAVMAAAPLLEDQDGLVLIAYADMPLLTSTTFERLIELQSSNSGPLTLVTICLEDSHGFGRVIRQPDGSVSAVVEEAQATPEQLKVQELNAGVYCFSAAWLWGALKRIKVSPKGEYYLTDVVALAVADGLRVQALTLQDTSEALGVNTRIHLAEAEQWMRKRINQAWMLAGVSFINPEAAYIEADVQIGCDTTIYPDTYLRGKTVIGSGCIIGPNTIMTDTAVGKNCKILCSVLEGAVVENEVEIGPFGRLRKGAHLADHVHMGNFGEVKNSYLGEGTKMGHFSYIGDAEIGTNVNIGCGTITCNFDGKHKFKTKIGNNVFIGSDTMLVAPLTIGENARTGAGAVVTHDVAPETIVVGVPARLLRKVNEDD
jgi:bifunctional UDP-N-acetylglucosamine pyrophosphorylase / glucosamine-1-phosphate N-acetyltransferase